MLFADNEQTNLQAFGSFTTLIIKRQMNTPPYKPLMLPVHHKVNQQHLSQLCLQGTTNPQPTLASRLHIKLYIDFQKNGRYKLDFLVILSIAYIAAVVNFDLSFISA